MPIDFELWAVKALKLLVAAIITLVAAVHLSPTLTTLFWLMLLDLLSGMVIGFKSKKLSSSRGYDGIKKKAMMWILLGGAHLSDRVINVGFDFEEALGVYFIINEMLSLIENSALLGVPFPPYIIETLMKLKASPPATTSVPVTVEVKGVVKMPDPNAVEPSKIIEP